MCRLLKVVLPVVVAAMFLSPPPAYAQVGAISGLVRDQSGGVLPGVTVEVTSPALIEKVRSSISEGNGRYQITALPVGTYTVTFTLSGFSTVRREGVVVTSDFTANIVADMRVGGLEDTVTVTAETPVVDVSNARVQHVFQGSDIGDLPTQRDIPSILNLVPGLQASSLRGSCNGGVGGFCNPTVPLFNSHSAANDIDGQNQGRIMVDGMSINMGRSGAGINENVGLANGIVLNTANAQEVSFTLSGSLGESETGGAAINIVPRTGGNRYSGNYSTTYTQTSFFDDNRQTRLTWVPPTNANPTGSVTNTRPGFVPNFDFDVAGAFGGPVVRDRLWFYLSARMQNRETYPGGSEQGFTNRNEGLWGANYQPQRTCNAPRSCDEDGWLTFTNEYKNASLRLTLQATQRNKFNIYWDEQDSCTNPCYGMISVTQSPESYFTLMSRPNRLMQLSWTNPFTNQILFDAGLTVVLTHQDQTKSREFVNPRQIPRICEAGLTAGGDDVASRVNTFASAGHFGAGSCPVLFGATLNSGSLNDQFPGFTPNTLVNDDTYRSRASISYITGSHNVKLGWDGAYFMEKTRNEVNDPRLTYHYNTPNTTGAAWTVATRSGNCLLAPGDDPFACGNMSLPIAQGYHSAADLDNRLAFRPVPIGFQMNSGVGITDERVWFGALYLQDQWTLNRLTLNGAIRYDHAASRYGESCIGPDTFVAEQWCSRPQSGASYHDITPRWGVAWDVFGNGKTSVKWNMGKYLQAAGFGGLYTNYNDARRSTNVLTRAWSDLNGDRMVNCNFTDPNPHYTTDPNNLANPTGDWCGSMLTGAGQPSAAFQQFGREPNTAQLQAFAAANSACGIQNQPEAQQNYCDASGQDLMHGWNTRRNEWQFGLGIQHEILPRVSAEVTYNRRKYGNLTDNDTINLGCDYYGAHSQAMPHTLCAESWMNYTDPTGLRDFFTLTAPVDSRLPEGGGYLIRGLTDERVSGALPAGGGNVASIRQDLSYAWNGVDTNFVFRARGGLRISGGTSTGRAQRNQCYVDVDTPQVKGRVGNEYGGQCINNEPFLTNVRANASYTIPFIDVLTGVVFQYRPGAVRNAMLIAKYTDVVWEPEFAARRENTPFNNTQGTTDNTVTVNLLDNNDLYGEGQRLWDLTFSKNFRFAGKRLSAGVDVYNLFNTDAATAYVNDYRAWRDPATGEWRYDDDPSTPGFEFQDWGRVTGIVNPRFMRLRITLDF